MEAYGTNHDSEISIMNKNVIWIELRRRWGLLYGTSHIKTLEYWSVKTNSCRLKFGSRSLIFFSAACLWQCRLGGRGFIIPCMRKMTSQTFDPDFRMYPRDDTRELSAFSCVHVCLRARLRAHIDFFHGRKLLFPPRKKSQNGCRGWREEREFPFLNFLMRKKIDFGSTFFLFR